MPDIKVVGYSSQDFFHVTSNTDVSVWNKTCYDYSIANEEVHALLETHKFRGSDASCLVSL